MADENAFLSAVSEGDMETASSYIKRYPEKWRTASHGFQNSCLHLARDAEMAEYLISAGADMEARASRKWWSNGSPILDKGCDIFVEGSYGNALVQASYVGHTGIVQRLISLGFDVNEKSKGETALHFASAQNRVNTAEYLLEVGAEIEAVNASGRTPFLEAVRADNLDIINLLISKGCNIYAKDKMGRGALEIAGSEKCLPRAGAKSLKEELEKIFSNRQTGFIPGKAVRVKLFPPSELRVKEGTDIAPTLPKYVRELKRQLVAAEKEINLTRAKERKLSKSLFSSEQIVCDLQRRLSTALSEKTKLETETAKILLENKEQKSEIERISEICSQLQDERDEEKNVAAEAKENLMRYEKVQQVRLSDVVFSDVKLGEGSHGSVSVGRWRGCNVAVKTFYDFLCVDAYLGRLQQEISICSLVHHPNVVSLLGVVTQDEIPLKMLSELLEASLSDIIAAARGRLFLREKVDMALGCSSGILHLHSLDVLHGDIRSTNVVVTSMMQAKICDLGAARFSEISRKSIGPMSFDYIAPERLQPGQHNTRMADVYSLGVTFIELMTGQQPTPHKRKAQGAGVRHSVIKGLCLKMIRDESFQRPSAGECLATLESIQKSDEEYKKCPAKRMVKGKMHGGQNVELVCEPWN